MLVSRIAVYTCCLVIGSPAIAQDARFELLFDGETLSGWEGNAQTFRVVDGAIVAGSTDAPIEQDEFLCADEEFGDFELELEARMSEGQIGGVQFRGQRIPDSTQVGGYQADMGFIAGQYIPMLSDLKDVDEERQYPLWGSLLDEYRTDRSRYPDPNTPYWLLAVANPDSVERVLNRGGWNRINIRAIGPAISIRLNGALTVDYVEQDPVPESGLICVQVHSGPPSLVAYRDIKIRRIHR